MRASTALLFALVLTTFAAPQVAHAQPADITIQNCVAFDITGEDRFCCYVFTLCIENYSLPPIDAVGLVLGNSAQCVSPVGPDGWEASAAGPSAIEWEADPGDEIPPGVMLCGFQFSSDSRVTSTTITLLAAGAPVFEGDFSFTCSQDCAVPVDPGTWGRIKTIYVD